VAWGDPAVIVRCGVDRPADLKPGSAAQFQLGGSQTDAGPHYDITKSGSANVWTTVDRAAYISVEVPSKYNGIDVMPPLSQAIELALPAVCSTDSTRYALQPEKLCTRRP
jgi:hypothetical protein